MKKIKKIIDALNLLYYEYNKKTNTLFLDKNATKEDILRERIKATYALTTNEIEFFIDANENIVISHKDKFIVRLKQRWRNLLSNIRNNGKKIYILSDKKVKNTINLPIFDIEYIKQDIDLSGYDALIFTSKNAIKAINSMDKTWKSIPSYVIAPQTAKTVKSLGGNLTFIGKAHHGDAFAQEIQSELKGKKVLYVSGKKVVSNLVNILKDNGVLCDSKVFYKTVCKQYKERVVLPKNSIIIFSAPSTIECFLNNVTWDESFRAISIGKTTAKYFPDYIEPIISDTTSLDACVQKAQELS